MPENYTISFVPPERHINKQLQKSRKIIKEIAEKIVLNNKRKIKRNIFSFCDKIHEKNAAKWVTMCKK
jgi:hypothetical protein